MPAATPPLSTVLTRLALDRIESSSAPLASSNVCSRLGSIVRTLANARAPPRPMAFSATSSDVTYPTSAIASRMAEAPSAVRLLLRNDSVRTRSSAGTFTRSADA